ncbi:MAG: Na+/H+ antiporter subunit E, partial [Pseudomonadota bacterium]
AILEMPLDVKSDIEILLVTNLISLTPGTLSLDVTPDRKTLIVHAMFADDPDEVIASLKSGMERLVKEVFEE